MTRLRIVTWNIHKGVNGPWMARRLEIHNLATAVDAFNADVVCLQEVRRFNHRERARFASWPDQPQAHFLAPEGYEAVYATHAVLRHGEHGNALLSRWPVIAHAQQDVSDHLFEQRGLLHVHVLWEQRELHVIVVHLGLFGRSRLRQAAQVMAYIEHQVPADACVVLAGDFNDWAEKLHAPLRRAGLSTFEGLRLPTFPSRLPMLHLDRIYARGLVPITAAVPRGRAWGRMSDHLPLVGEFEAV